MSVYRFQYSWWNARLHWLNFMYLHIDSRCSSLLTCTKITSMLTKAWAQSNIIAYTDRKNDDTIFYSSIKQQVTREVKSIWSERFEFRSQTLRSPLILVITPTKKPTCICPSAMLLCAPSSRRTRGDYSICIWMNYLRLTPILAHIAESAM